MVNRKPGYLVDNIWVCPFCGALNAAYLTKCGRCGKEKTKNNSMQSMQ
jgi:ribosomal protein L40E